MLDFRGERRRVCRHPRGSRAVPGASKFVIERTAEGGGSGDEGADRSKPAHCGFPEERAGSERSRREGRIICSENEG